MRSALDLSYVAATILLSVYGQLALKWRIDRLAPLPAGAWPKLQRLFLLLFDPVIASTFLAAFAAALTWMVALSRFELSRIYPFTSLNFVLVLVVSVTLLGERLDMAKVVGIGLIVIGTTIASGLPR